jgi:hypothetical protein
MNPEPKHTGATAGRARLFVPLAFVLLFILTSSLPAQDAGRIKIADGEYLSRGQSGYNKDEKFRESWVLWRKGDGKFMVESDLQVEGTGKNQQVLHYSIQLSADMRLLEITTRAGENETLIELGAEEVRVKGRRGESTLKVPPRYDFYLPLPWCLGSFARRVPPIKSAGLPVMFVAADEQGPDSPMALTMLWGRVQWVGSEQVDAAGLRVDAEKYLVHLGPYPGVFIWLSKNGLMLASQNEENPEQRTETARFREYEKLPRLLRDPQQKPAN